MGGLLVSASDLAKYVGFQLSAWPPRDDPETGPVRRSSVREMNHLWRISNLSAGRQDGALQAQARGYGYGLGVSADCRFEHVAGHGGGLPGFGSYMAWLPQHGAGMFAMANLTYVGPAQAINESWDVLLKTGGLRERELPAAPVLTETRDRIVKLWRSWDTAQARQIAAVNLFLDVPEQQRKDQIERLKAEVGECSGIGPVTPENWLRGYFRMSCQKGDVTVLFTLAPTRPPGVQHLSFQRSSGVEGRLSAPTSPRSGVSCRE
jgi:hypothetical protein